MPTLMTVPAAIRASRAAIVAATTSSTWVRSRHCEPSPRSENGDPGGRRVQDAGDGHVRALVAPVDAEVAQHDRRRRRGPTYVWTSISAATFETPYGLSGRSGASSVTSPCATSPYTELLEATTSRRSPTASRRRCVTTALSRRYCSNPGPQLGCTPGRPPRWTTASTPRSSSRSPAVARSAAMTSTAGSAVTARRWRAPGQQIDEADVVAASGERGAQRTSDEPCTARHQHGAGGPNRCRCDAHGSRR